MGQVMKQTDINKYVARLKRELTDIKIVKDSNGILVTLWKPDGDPNENIGVFFSKEKVLYYGDLGTWVFGQNIQEPCLFFGQVSLHNYRYCYEKVEAAERDTLVFDSELFNKNVMRDLKLWLDLPTDRAVLKKVEDEAWDVSGYDGLEYADNEYEAYSICSVLEEAFGDNEIKSNISDSFVYCDRFRIACDMLCYISNLKKFKDVAFPKIKGEDK